MCVLNMYRPIVLCCHRSLQQ